MRTRPLDAPERTLDPGKTGATAPTTSPRATPEKAARREPNGAAHATAANSETTDRIFANTSAADGGAAGSPEWGSAAEIRARPGYGPIRFNVTQPVAARQRSAERLAEWPSERSAHDDCASSETRPPFRRPENQPEEAPHNDLPILDGIFLPDAILPGTLLNGRYEIQERVEHDGMGIVYKALDRNRQGAGSSQPWVALKFARPSGDDAAATVLHLRQEFLKLSQLNHPHIVAVYDLASDHDVEFMVLEWLNGKNLAETIDGIRSKRIALGKAIDIIRSAADALAFAHASGIVHGDVKPSNIFVTGNGAVKVLDFGASWQTPSGAAVCDQASWATPAYASCEVLAGQPPQPGDDVYSLGVTAYYLLSGERPFGDLDAIAARDAGLAAKPLPDDAGDYWPAIEKALRVTTVERFNNAQEFLEEFTATPEMPPRVKFRPALSFEVPTYAYGAAVLLVLMAIVLWAVPGGDGSRQEIRSQLDGAAAAVAAGRLKGPGEDTAQSLYMNVLADDPGNADAIDGLDAIAEEYLARARSALASGDFASANGNLRGAREVQPEHFGIPVIAELFDRHRRDLLVRARQASATDPAQAERYLMLAATLSDANDPDIARVRDELQQEKSAAAVDALLRGIDQRILSERLTVPQGDSAVDLMRRASQLAPGNRQVQVAAERIASALLFQSMFAISNEKLDAAQSYIDSAKALKVKHLALARAEYELARARTRAVASPE
jgi:hypothetical protein